MLELAPSRGRAAANSPPGGVAWRNLTIKDKRMKQLTILLGILLLVGCAGERLESGRPPVPQEFAMDKSYRIGVGDELKIQVWRNEELSGQVPVRQIGRAHV